MECRMTRTIGFIALFASATVPPLTAQSGISGISPGRNRLAPGSTGVALSFSTATATLCRYSVGSQQGFASMQPFDSSPASTSHSGTVKGLLSSPSVLNNVYLACDSNPLNVTTLQYRAAASPTGSFPRIGSIWWGSYIASTAPG